MKEPQLLVYINNEAIPVMDDIEFKPKLGQLSCTTPVEGSFEVTLAKLPERREMKAIVHKDKGICVFLLGPEWSIEVPDDEHVKDIKSGDLVTVTIEI